MHRGGIEVGPTEVHPTLLQANRYTNYRGNGWDGQMKERERRTEEKDELRKGRIGRKAGGEGNEREKHEVRE